MYSKSDQIRNVEIQELCGVAITLWVTEECMKFNQVKTVLWLHWCVSILQLQRRAQPTLLITPLINLLLHKSANQVRFVMKTMR